MRKKRITVFTCLWGRPFITDIFAAGIERLKSDLTEYDIQCVAAVSNLDDMALAEKHGFLVQKAPNQNLGRKWNIAAEKALDTGGDYFLQMGSDDLVSSEYVLKAIGDIDKGFNVVGQRTLYFVNAINLKSVKYTYNTEQRNLIGAGRVFDPSVLTGSINKQGRCALWPDKAQKGLDGMSEMIASDNGNLIREVNINGIHVVDVKSAENIWRFDHFRSGKIECSFDEASWFMSEKEKKLIYNYFERITKNR